MSTGWGAPSEDTVAHVRGAYEVDVFGVIRATLAFLPLLERSEAPRIAMISSTLKLLRWASDFDAPNAGLSSPGYDGSKSALNAATVAFAKELGPLGFKVNAGCPGYAATDLNQHSGPRTPREGAAIGVRLATVPAEGLNGGFFDDAGVVA